MRTSPGGFSAFCSSILSERAPKPPRFGWTFCPGDKVMQTENDYDKEVHNGNVGIVSRIDLEESELTADFEGREDGLDRSVWHRHRY